MNNAGARYPWMTSFDGSEQCESWDIGASELHITADIPFAMQQYLDATGDEDFYLQAISVVLHDQFSETDNSLMIGHVGVMLPTSDAVYFVEKVAFQEPYRLLKFKNRTELSDYLMLKYDNSWGQDTAHTFIINNGLNLICIIMLVQFCCILD